MPKTIFRLLPVAACLTLAASAYAQDSEVQTRPLDILGQAVSEDVARDESGQMLQETPKKEMSSDEVFNQRRAQPQQPRVTEHSGGKRPTIRFREREQKAAKEVKVEEEKFLYPSLAFMNYFDPWKLKVDDLWLLQDNYAALKRKHPGCRRVDGPTTDGQGRIACPDTHNFRSEGQEVVFRYSKVNEVLTGAVFTFNSQFRAMQFAQGITKWLDAAKIPSFVAYEDDQGKGVDTPMFSVSVQPTPTGWLVNIEMHFEDRMADAENHFKFKAQKIEFGNLTLGTTTRDTLPAIPKSCEEVSNDPTGLMREFYGICFDFPYEAHMQVNFNEATGILNAAVLSPIGAATGGLVEDMLTKRYGLPTFCPRMVSDLELTGIKEAAQKGKTRMRRVKGRSAMVYAGTCTDPIVYTMDMRYVFENRLLNETDMMTDFERRKGMVSTDAAHSQAFDARLDKVKGFFE